MYQASFVYVFQAWSWCWRELVRLLQALGGGDSKVLPPRIVLLSSGIRSSKFKRFMCYGGQRTETKQRYLGYEWVKFLSSSCFPLLGVPPSAVQSADDCLCFPHFSFVHLSTSIIRYLRTAERPMKIEIVVDPARPAPPQSLVSRVAPAATVATTATDEVQTPRLVLAHRFRG
jgi:hypothetical protein